jgi:hypothetical protein
MDEEPGSATPPMETPAARKSLRGRCDSVLPLALDEICRRRAPGARRLQINCRHIYSAGSPRTSALSRNWCLVEKLPARPPLDHRSTAATINAAGTEDKGPPLRADIKSLANYRVRVPTIRGRLRAGP